MVIRIAFLLMLSVSAFAQPSTDTLYTMKLSTARLLVQDALKKRQLDSLNQEYIKRLYIADKSYQALQVDCWKVKKSFEERLEKYEDSNKILESDNKDLRTDVRKEQKKVKGWKVGTVIGFGIGLYLGIQASKD